MCQSIFLCVAGNRIETRRIIGDLHIGRLISRRTKMSSTKGRIHPILLWLWYTTGCQSHLAMANILNRDAYAGERSVLGVTMLSPGRSTENRGARWFGTSHSALIWCGAMFVLRITAGEKMEIPMFCGDEKKRKTYVFDLERGGGNEQNPCTWRLWHVEDSGEIFRGGEIVKEGREKEISMKNLKPLLLCESFRSDKHGVFLPRPTDKNPVACKIPLKIKESSPTPL